MLKKCVKDVHQKMHLQILWIVVSFYHDKEAPHECREYFPLFCNLISLYKKNSTDKSTYPDQTTYFHDIVK